jgi:hypothetical protein
MRIALCLLVLLLAAPRHAVSNPIVEMQFLNSELNFGPSADQLGWDLSSFWASGFDDSDWSVWNTAYQALAGPLDHQSLLTDEAGNVIGGEYVYLGGTFEIFFVFENAGDLLTGSFVAPIERLTVRSGDTGGSPVDLTYALGAGLFDEAIASTLGISRRTSGGQARAQLLLHDGLSGADLRRIPEHQASDGVNDIALDVVEPGAVSLVAAGLAAMWRRRRSTRR